MTEEMNAEQLIEAMREDTATIKKAMKRNIKHADALAKIDWDLKKYAASAASMDFAGVNREVHGLLDQGHARATVALEKFYPDGTRGPGGR